MADFAVWVASAEPSLPWRDGEFMAAYRNNRKSANELALEASPITGPLRELADAGPWSGTASELLTEIERRVPEQTKITKSWPKNPRTFSERLRRLAPNFRSMGIGIELGQTRGSGSQKVIHIVKEMDSRDACDAPGEARSLGTDHRISGVARLHEAEADSADETTS